MNYMMFYNLQYLTILPLAKLFTSQCKHLDYNISKSLQYHKDTDIT